LLAIHGVKILFFSCTFVSPKVPKGLARTMRLPALKKQQSSE
jgi:hypothetical protein